MFIKSIISKNTNDLLNIKEKLKPYKDFLKLKGEAEV